MKIERVWALYFSATGTTGKVVRAVGESAAEALGLALGCVELTRPGAREQLFSFGETDLVIVGTPTYAGRVPNKLLPFFQTQLSGGGALAVPVVLFGNRSYDNALAELCAVLERDGFHTAAAAAFVGRHAFTDKLGQGRPDWEDLAQAKNLGNNVADKVKNLTGTPLPIRVPGDPEAPYYVPKGLDGQPVKFLKAKPVTDLGRCSHCGVCQRACPMGAIDLEDAASVPGTCIKCQACVRKCTKHAKSFDDPAFLSHVAMLEANFTEPKENEVFL